MLSSRQQSGPQPASSGVCRGGERGHQGAARVLPAKRCQYGDGHLDTESEPAGAACSCTGSETEVSMPNQQTVPSGLVLKPSFTMPVGFVGTWIPGPIGGGNSVFGEPV